MSPSSRNRLAVGRVRLILLYVVVFSAVLVAANIGASLWRVQGQEPPEYGTWTAVLEVERKIRLLRDFAREGDVDALILSSSMGDHGISASVLSRDISAGLGRPFRVFNFSMGGADLTTYPMLYRFATLVAHPKEIWIVSPVSNTPLQPKANSLDQQLLDGPIGSTRKLPILLPLSFAFHNIALVRNAAPLRDWIFYGRFAHRPISNLDLYDINQYGDTLSWIYNVPLYVYGEKRRVDRYDEIMKFVRQPNAKGDEQHHEIYFPSRMLEAVTEMRSLAADDGANIKLIAFDTAVSLARPNPEFLEASQRFFKPLASYFDAPVIDVRGEFDAKPYMISDPTHLNTIGSETFSSLLASRITGKPAPAVVEFAVAEKIANLAPDPTWTPFTALVRKRRDDPSGSLNLQYFQNWGLPILRPFSNVRLAVRLADGTDLVLPARVLPGGRVIVDTSGLAFGQVDQILTVQLVPWNGKMGAGLGAPLVAYRWSAESHPAVYFQEGLVTVSTPSETYSSSDPIPVVWEKLADPARLDWVGIFPVAAPLDKRISFMFTQGKEKGKLTFPPVGKPGEYELRMFRNNGWESVAASKPFNVEAAVGRVTVADATIVAGNPVRVAWSRLNQPNKQDWLGLFRVGTKDDSRMEIRYTGGAKDGALEIPVAGSTSPGEYEVRLFSAGGWARLATSSTFSITLPDTSPAAAAPAR